MKIEGFFALFRSLSWLNRDISDNRGLFCSYFYKLINLNLSNSVRTKIYLTISVLVCILRCIRPGWNRKTIRKPFLRKLYLFKYSLHSIHCHLQEVQKTFTDANALGEVEIVQILITNREHDNSCWAWGVLLILLLLPLSRLSPKKIFVWRFYTTETIISIRMNTTWSAWQRWITIPC